MIGFLATLADLPRARRSFSPEARRSDRRRRVATALTGGLAVGAGWFFGLTPPSALKGWVFLPLLVALLGPAVSPPSRDAVPAIRGQALSRRSGVDLSAA